MLARAIFKRFISAYYELRNAGYVLVENALEKKELRVLDYKKRKTEPRKCESVNILWVDER